jgi:ribosomal-protein-alanine N-acetyltransferase
MMEILRCTSVEEIDPVIELARRSPGAPQWDRSNYEYLVQLGESAATFVAQEGDAPLGFAVATLAVDICEMESIVVAPEFRRRGTGAALLKAILGWARKQRAQRVELEVRAGNRPAIALYERAGFIRDGRRRGYYRNPDEDAILMGLPLVS